MSKLIDLSGKTFGRLTVIEREDKDKFGNLKWLCNCMCGNKTSVRGYALKNGSIKSCGCLSRELTKQRSTTHSKSRTPEYAIWTTMIQRCTNKKNKDYPNYGGRGISVCEDWLNSFENFYRDMGDKPSNDHSIDRINVNENYEISNCRWATRTEQQNNRRPLKLGKTNTSGHKGIYWNKYANKWIAETRVNGKAKYIGCFSDKEEAILAQKEVLDQLKKR